MKKNSYIADNLNLREKATELLKTKPLKIISKVPVDEMKKLIDEFEVQQIELELQNEELLIAKSEAQKSTEKYIALYNYAPSGYFTISKDGQIIDLNIVGANMIGENRSSYKNSLFSSYVSNETKPIFDHFLLKIFDTKVKDSCEVILLTNNNESIYVYITGTVIENGEQCLVNVIDITKQKKVEAELIQEQYLMNSLMDNLPDHIYFKDRDSRFIRINDAHAKSFGLSKRGEEIGKSDFDFFTEEHARQAYEDEQSIIHSGKPLIKEEKNTWKDRPVTWVSTIKLPLTNLDGKIVGTFGISRDITKRKQDEEELNKALGKAEESDRLKTAFLNNISHEIRTPFNGILGFLSIIQDEDLTSNEREEYISIINQSADRLMNSINDIVEISQIQAGQMQLIITETNIKKLTGELVDHFKRDAESQGIEFIVKMDIPRNLWCIPTDGAKLKTVLSNLMSNALKFTKSGSIEFEIRKKGEYLEFSVKDTGMGISDNQKLIIFERFRQADVSRIRQFEGLGLGLSIAKSYVEMLGGKIWVESELEKGSIFHFTIPCNGAQNKFIEAKDPETIKRTKSIQEELISLIVEDEEPSAVLLDEIVYRYSKKILRARTGVEAVEICRSNPDVNLILMDIRLPELSGLEATKLIRQFNKEVIIIAQTAYASSRDRENAIESGCDDYISKPFTKDLMMEMIKKYFK